MKPLIDPVTGARVDVRDDVVERFLKLGYTAFEGAEKKQKPKQPAGKTTVKK